MNRIHITIPEPTIKQLDDLLPKGTRSTVIRKTLDLIVASINDHGPGIIGLILTGDIKISPAESKRQNLTHSEKLGKDEKRTTDTEDN